METIYERNGLIFWTQEEIAIRRMMEDYFVRGVSACLKDENRAFEFVQVEAPILTPRQFVNPQYTEEDIYILPDGNSELTLRPETTMGSYGYAKALLSHKGYRPPIVVWQHGKSFRREQDLPSKYMRLKEFYQLEFQIIFSPKTANDYSKNLLPSVCQTISELIGECRLEDSDRIPHYAEWTKDVVCVATEMEVCSMSKRKDYENMNVLEVAIGTDRCVYNFLKSRRK